MFQQPASSVRALLAVAMAAGLAACAGPAPRESGSSAAEPVVRAAQRPAAPARPVHEAAAVVAVRQVGVPYVYGGSDRRGFDCSGLVWFAYRHAGKHVPRTTRTLWDALRPVARGQLRVGDVLFFRIAGKMSHVGLYLGEGRFVHAPSSGREVTIAALDAPFYREAFIRAGRP